MMWPFHSTSDSHGIHGTHGKPSHPTSVCFFSLVFLISFVISSNVQTNAGPTPSEWWGVEVKHNRGAGVRGFRGFRGHFTDRDNFLRTFARFVVYQISNHSHDHILSSCQKNINEI